MVERSIRLKRVYDSDEENDGCRVLVDGVWPRGMRREDLAADHWLKDLAPSKDLRQWFGHDPDRWPEFRRRYFAELDARPAAVRALGALLDEERRVTLLFSAKDERHNQAVALRDYLRERGYLDQRGDGSSGRSGGESGHGGDPAEDA